MRESNVVLDVMERAETVHVIYGAHQLHVPCAGLSVAQVMLVYKDLMSMADAVEAYVNGTRVLNNVILQGDERIEFMRHAGKKGQDYWSKREFMRLTKISEEQWAGLRAKGLRTFHVGEDEVIDDAECQKWIQRLIYSDDSIERAASKGKAGRKNTTADIAEFANGRRPRKGWKAILGEWRTLYPNDTRVKNWQQIRDAWRRRYQGKR